MNVRFMRFPGGREKALTLSYDDGVQSDARLIDIMKESGLKGTFNLNSGIYAPEGKVYPEGTYSRRLSEKQATKLYRDSGMEVAVHSLTHPFLEKLTPGNCCYEVIQDRKNLEAQFGGLVRGMAYPYGTYSEAVVQCLRQCDIAYARTVETTRKFDLPENWLTLHPTCHHNDSHLGELTEKFLSGQVKRDPWLFYLWGHSYEFERDKNWERMENFAQKIGNREEIWYATNMEIYNYVEAYKKLESSADGKRLYNPTLQTLYFVMNGVPGSIQPGETKDME